jgi:hypothetical protein
MAACNYTLRQWLKFRLMKNSHPSLLLTTATFLLPIFGVFAVDVDSGLPASSHALTHFSSSHQSASYNVT